MKKIIVLSLVSLSLLACETTSRETIARDAAKEILRPIVQQRFPNIPTDTAVDCAVDHASLDELASLALSATTGQAAPTAKVASQILAKPEVLECTAKGVMSGITGNL